MLLTKERTWEYLVTKDKLEKYENKIPCGDRYLRKVKHIRGNHGMAYGCAGWNKER